ncbi:MAG TPA: hypothetical protein VKX28_01665 [Xanthobacteraceae bacterium]|nr:hypothetical protein [Xanthobacteraceae bacterium]
MTSARKVFANRANGRLSKGPRTVGGRQRHDRAPLRHGLSLPVLLDAALAPEVDALAREIIATSAAGPIGDAHRAIASRIAEAMIDLRRVRLAKRPLSIALDADPANIATLKALARLDRYERRALSRRKFAVREFAAALAGTDPARPRRTRWPGFPGLAILAKAPNWDNSSDLKGHATSRKRRVNSR